MTREKYEYKREELCRAMGVCVYAYIVYSAPFEAKGDKPPVEEYQRFQIALARLAKKAAKLEKKKMAGLKNGVE